MTIREMMAREYKMAEHFLIFYDSEQKKYAEELAEYLTKEKSEVSGGGRGGVSDPTGVLAVKRVEFERKSEAFAWLDAVRSVYDSLTDVEKMVIKWRRDFDCGKYRKRGRGRPPWIINAVVKFAVECDMVVSDHTVRKLWANVIRMVVFAANKRRW